MFNEQGHVSVDDIRKLFADRQLRCTNKRIALYKTLQQCCSHPTAEELHDMVNGGSGEHLSLATVYNCLEAFCEAGLVQRMPTANGSCRYDANTDGHLHIRYRDSTKIDDVPPHLSDRLRKAISPRLKQAIEAELGLEIEQINIQLIASRRADQENSANNAN